MSCRNKSGNIAVAPSGIYVYIAIVPLFRESAKNLRRVYQEDRKRLKHIGSLVTSKKTKVII